MANEPKVSALLTELRDALYEHRYKQMPIAEVEAWIERIDREAACSQPVRPVSTPRCPDDPFNPANLEANAGLAATLWHQFCELTKCHEGNPPLDWWGFKWAAYAMAGLEALPRESQGSSEERAFRKGMSRFKVTEQLWNEYRANRDDLPEFARLPVDTQLFAQYIVGSQFFHPGSQPAKERP